MGHKKFSLISLVISMIAGVASVSACAADLNIAPITEPTSYKGLSATNTDNRADVQGFAQAIPEWQQVNTNGFGDPQTGEVTALESFNGYLYAGTHHPIDPAQLIDGAQIFRSADGVTWTPVTQPGFGNSHDIAPPAILDFIVFNNRLYASTGRGNASQIWRTSNGTIWAPMDVTGFSDPDNVDVTSLAVYNGMIYAGVTNQATGAQIWRSFTGDNNSWTQVAPVIPGMTPASITGFAEFGIDGGLYAAVESESPAQIWRSYGSSWEVTVNDGFGDANTLLTGGMVEFGGYLYVGAGNTASGALLWRTNDGATWEQAIPPGFGDPNNQQVEMIFVFENQLYAMVQNGSTGLEIWRSSDGILWEQANLDGFGDSNNSTANGRNATASFLGQLYVGTSNIKDGGELWRKLPQPTDPPTPTNTSTVISTSTSTSTFTPTSTYTPTSTSPSTGPPTLTATSTMTPGSNHTPTFTLTSSPTNTLFYTLTHTPTNTATATVTTLPTFTPTYTPTSTPSNTPTPTPIPNTPGKVTGGGNIDLSNGKASFGFVVQFDDGDKSPSGNLTFIDHSAKFKLKATSFELLVIEGTQTWLKGTGNVENGQVVKFEINISVPDKLDQPETFYISIPELQGYRFGGALTGGNITIHK